MIKITSYKKDVCKILLGIVLFIYVFNFFSSDINRYKLEYVLSPDSMGYIIPGFKVDPWVSARSPLYPFFCGFFFSDKEKEHLSNSLTGYSYIDLFDAREGKIEKIIFEKGLNKNFEYIVFFQRVFQALSLVLLFCALNKLFKEVVSFGAIITSVWILPLANTYLILTEPLYQSCVISTISCLILFRFSHKFFWMYMACLLAVFTYLCRPAGIFIVFLTLLYIFYFIYTAHYKNLGKFFICCMILSSSLVYILYMSYPIGSIVFGTLTDKAKNGFSLYFLDENDVSNMPTRRSKLFAKTFLENMDNFKKEYRAKYGVPLLEKSEECLTIKSYTKLLCPYIFDGEGSTLKLLSKDRDFSHLNLKDKTKLALELENGIQKRHKLDILKLKFQMFLSGFGFFKEYNHSYLSKTYVLSPYIWAISFLIVLIFFPNYRFCIVLLNITHILHIAACAYGHVVIQRFTDVTELLPLIATLLSLWVVFMRIISLFLNIIHKPSCA